MSRIAKPVNIPTTYVSTQDAVAHGYAAYSTLRLWIAQGKLPAVKLGGRVKIKLEDLEALAEPMQPTQVEGAEDLKALAEPKLPEDTELAIKRLIAAAPPLSAEQRERLALLIGGAA